MNAAEAMYSVQERARTLTIRSALDENRFVLVSIEDTGIGIDPADLSVVFKPLFTTKTGGMGMGLSICRSIVEAHHGRIWAVPAREFGSVFEFVLPTQSSEVSNAEPVSQ
jgi:signal transduction histidine kinase